MERTSWTDERLDDAMTRIDARFDRLEAEVADLRREMQSGFGDIRREMHDGFAQIHRSMYNGTLVLGAGYLGLAAAVLAAGS